MAFTPPPSTGRIVAAASYSFEFLIALTSYLKALLRSTCDRWIYRLSVCDVRIADRVKLPACPWNRTIMEGGVLCIP
jgi:hypothetical protein